MANFPSVLGIDPASKTSTVFDGTQFESLKPVEVSDRVRDVPPATLICWDAPLTGPADATKVENLSGAYSIRTIERFFFRQRSSSPLQQQAGLKPPTGVNTLNYSSMSHWALTRAITGYPRVGPYDAEPAFSLAFGAYHPDEHYEAVLAEVHPALAVWLWLLGDREDLNFQYKASTATASERAATTRDLATRLCDVLSESFSSDPELVFGRHGKDWILNEIDGDSDALDAYVAWVLGRLWGAGTKAVLQLGDIRTGALLLPNVPAVVEAWEREITDPANS